MTREHSPVEVCDTEVNMHFALAASVIFMLTLSSAAAFGCKCAPPRWLAILGRPRFPGWPPELFCPAGGAWVPTLPKAPWLEG